MGGGYRSRTFETVFDAGIAEKLNAGSTKARIVMV
jgi:hypothetical protein